jgi:hypothetical protein
VSLSNPKLYAVVPATAPAATPMKKPAAGAVSAKRAAAAASKAGELETKKAIDRADAVLTRLGSRAGSYAKQIAILQRRKAIALARAERLEDAIIRQMQAAKLTKVDGFKVTLSTRDAAPALVVDDQSLIPDAYMRTKLVSEPMKVEIKAALAKGEQIEGVHLTQKISLIRKAC